MIKEKEREMSDVEETQDNIKYFQKEINYQKNTMFTELQALRDFTAAKGKVYDNYEHLDTIDSLVYAHWHALVGFLDKEINSLNCVLSKYDDLLEEMCEVIKTLDTKNIYKIDEIMHEDED
jgi:hypothetical protein